MKDDQHLVSIVPEIQTRTWKHDLSENCPPLREGEFIISVKKGKKPGSVYQLLSFRKVKSTKYPRRYAVTAIKCPELLSQTTISFRFQATVMGEPARVIIWYSTKRKK